MDCKFFTSYQSKYQTIYYYNLLIYSCYGLLWILTLTCYNSSCLVLLFGSIFRHTNIVNNMISIYVNIFYLGNFKISNFPFCSMHYWIIIVLLRTITLSNKQYLVLRLKILWSKNKYIMQITLFVNYQFFIFKLFI